MFSIGTFFAFCAFICTAAVILLALHMKRQHEEQKSNKVGEQLSKSFHV